MPRSVPVKKVMISRNAWPQLRARTPVRDAIRVLRILTEEKKLEHGHATPLVLDDNYNLVGMLQLTDLLRSVRHLCEAEDKACDLGRALSPVEELAIPFPGEVSPEDSILDALDVMTNSGVGIVPVMKDGRLEGIVQLSDIFATVASLLFDEPESGWMEKYLHWG